MPVEEVYTRPPAKPADVPLRLYSNPICPFVQRVKLIVAAKQIPHDVVDIHLKQKPTWFVEEINPSSKLVPVIEHDGHLVRESLIAFDYLDTVFGGESLWPSDPYKKAVAQTLVSDFGNQFTSNYYKYYRKANDESTDAAIENFLRILEEHITSNGGQFFQGERAGATDYLIWPWIERMEAFTEVLGMEKFVNKQKQPVLYGWIARMHEVDAVKATRLPVEVHVAFLKSVQESGGAKHDYGLVDTSGKGIKIYASKPSQ